HAATRLSGAGFAQWTFPGTLGEVGATASDLQTAAGGIVEWVADLTDVLARPITFGCCRGSTAHRFARAHSTDGRDTLLAGRAYAAGRLKSTAVYRRTLTTLECPRWSVDERERTPATGRTNSATLGWLTSVARRLGRHASAVIVVGAPATHEVDA